MAQTRAQRAAAQAVVAWLAAHQHNKAWLVERTGADAGTIGDFLNNARWPKFKTQGRIERALDWEPGTLHRISNGEEPPPVAHVVEETHWPLETVPSEELLAELGRRLQTWDGTSR